MTTSPSSLRSRAAAAALAGLLIFPLAPAVAEPAADSATLAPTAQQSSQGQSLTWGFRQSFISYVGGHHRIDDGVTESNREYTFPLTDVKQEGDRVELSGHGLLQFAQYCKDTSDTNTCQLDLTFTAPRVVLDPSGESAIYYTVRTRNYQSGQVEGPHEVKMATLDLTSATQNAEGGVVTWSNIPATLTEDGAHAFSNFYDPGTALAPLSLTYRGEAIDVTPASYTVAESWDSKAETRDLHRVLELKGRVLHLTKTSWGDGEARATVLDARTMEPLHTVELPVTASMAVAVDSAAGRLYYADRQTHALASAVITEDGSLRLEGTVPGGEIGEDAFALGYDPTRGTLAALTLDGQGSGSIRFLDSEGKVTEHALPDPVSISPKLSSLPRPESLQTGEFYGSTYLNNARLLAPLPDGTFVYAPGSTVYDDEDIRVLTGHVLHFSPQGSRCAMSPIRSSRTRPSGWTCAAWRPPETRCCDGTRIGAGPPLIRCCATGSTHSGSMRAAIRPHRRLVSTSSATIVHFGGFLNRPDPGKMEKRALRAPVNSCLSASFMPMCDSRPVSNAVWISRYSAGSLLIGRPSSFTTWRSWV